MTIARYSEGGSVAKIAANDGTAPAGRVWVRRCRRCNRDDLSAAFGQPAMITGDWSCPTCGAERYEPVQRPLPAPSSTLDCPHVGSA